METSVYYEGVMKLPDVISEKALIDLQGFCLREEFQFLLGIWSVSLSVSVRLLPVSSLLWKIPTDLPDELRSWSIKREMEPANFTSKVQLIVIISCGVLGTGSQTINVKVIWYKHEVL